LTASYLYSIRRRVAIRVIAFAQGIIIFILPAMVLLLCWLFHFYGWLYVLLVFLALSILPFYWFRGNPLTSAAGRSYWMALLVFLFINCCLYPVMLRYQAGMAAGDYLRHELPSSNILYMPEKAPENYSVEFYSPCPVERVPLDSLPAILDRGQALFFARSAFSDTLLREGYHVDRLQRFPNFHVSQLSGAFLDHRTREPSLEWFELVRVSR
jgi:hypothetical protein